MARVKNLTWLSNHQNYVWLILGALEQELWGKTYSSSQQSTDVAQGSRGEVRGYGAGGHPVNSSSGPMELAHP